MLGQASAPSGAIDSVPEFIINKAQSVSPTDTDSHNAIDQHQHIQTWSSPHQTPFKAVGHRDDKLLDHGNDVDLDEWRLYLSNVVKPTIAEQETFTPLPETKKKTRRFTADEDEILEKGVSQRGGNDVDWEEISSLLVDRTSGQCRARYSRIKAKRKQEVTSAGSPSTALLATAVASVASASQPLHKRTHKRTHSDASAVSNDNEQESAENTPRKQRRGGTPPLTESNEPPSRDGVAPSKKIFDYFLRPAGFLSHSTRSPALTEHPVDDNGGIAADDRVIRNDQIWESKLNDLRKRVSELESDKDKIERERDQCRLQIEHLEAECAKRAADSETTKRECRKMLDDMELSNRYQWGQARAKMSSLLKEKADKMAAEKRASMDVESRRLARLVIERAGIEYVERWQEGHAFQAIHVRLAQIQREKNDIDQQRKLLTKRKTARPVEGGDSAVKVEPISSAQFAELDEIFKLRKDALKREDTDLQKEFEKLRLQRDLHQREVHRVILEDQSPLNSHPVLNERYALLELLGSGGFSEVWKGYDLVELREVACKIHSLHSSWSEERKRNYTKHALREYRIHKSLVHPRVVRLFDVFEIDHSSFCTVLELCEGGDLDTYLLSYKSISERLAKSIIIQVMSALKYFSELTPPIRNILLNPQMEIKITDFGLSKIIENDAPSVAQPPGGAREIALTSANTGTFYYLPPECFWRKGEVKISSKVDVWSIGVIFFELLYGRKPFGENQSQQTILRENTILHEGRTVEFPSTPQVSSETKAFIKRCLEYSQEQRPDVATLSQDPYLTFGAAAKPVSSKADETLQL
ncbi:hypothetical protein SmJEL517_g01208 [Synchytrium microbalum]|uniref:Protein kinase domain-containing protein n=1 Tax=Synchytrium microbalum TaxID=1806994 RepID=A0A507C579_9FUNG|nr:uncharacterized protein SmJEL517_g01208 [Synchytrium microbalum]TPX36710.1 hypothetical protein SmJEL517_g01208 [Synchytrium microbalum]